MRVTPSQPLPLKFRSRFTCRQQRGRCKEPGSFYLSMSASALFSLNIVIQLNQQQITIDREQQSDIFKSTFEQSFKCSSNEQERKMAERSVGKSAEQGRGNEAVMDDQEELEEKVNPEKCAQVNSQLPSEDEMYDIAELFKVFGDSTRIRILYVLFEESMCVGDIAQTLNMTTSAVSHQLRILKQAKLVNNKRDGKQIIYYLADEHVRIIISMGKEHIEEQ